MNIFFTTILLAFSGYCHAEKLITIYDSGDTLPISQYINRAPKQHNHFSFESIKVPSPPIKFPITTPAMQPGKIKPKAMSLPHLQTPLFLIGSDPFSRHWLTLRKNELKKIGAIGLLVEADTSETVVAVIKLAEGLRIIPASATDIAQSLSLRHYPVLLSKQGWEQ